MTQIVNPGADEVTSVGYLLRGGQSSGHDRAMIAGYNMVSRFVVATGSEQE